MTKLTRAQLLDAHINSQMIHYLYAHDTEAAIYSAMLSVGAGDIYRMPIFVRMHPFDEFMTALLHEEITVLNMDWE